MNLRRRTHGSSGESPISLFPFLAVLICTMGVLILLLVILVRQARLKALAQARAEAGFPTQQETTAPIPDDKELRRLEEDLSWQEQQLRTAREKTQSQLTEARLILGHVEDSIRRLREELQALQDRLKHLDRVSETKGPSLAELEQRVRELQEAALNLKTEVDTKEKEKRSKSYAIIPYQGKFGTTRRPIYLECRGDGVFLQPEGIRFSVQDFLGPLGPGNPLDAALRAIREELLARKEFDPLAEGEPYPLLIVRPDGIEAYYAARAAMTSWGTGSAYELVESDWNLTYPPRDPKLAEVVQQAVDLARRRQEFLVKAAPGKYGRSPRQYRAAPYIGGAVATGQADVPSEDPMLAQWQARQQSGHTSSEPQMRASDSGATSSGKAILEDATRLQGDTGGANTRTAGSPGGLVSAGTAGNRTPSQPAGQVTASDYQPMSPQQVVGSRVPASGSASMNNSVSDATIGVTVRPLAEQRGQNWGLPAHERSAIPVTRPIRIDCFSDRLVLVPEKGLDGIRVFYLDPSPEKAVEDLVKAIGDYVETWGIAGRGMYWRPVLSVHVASGAQQQFQMLRILLADSGLVVEHAR